MMAGPRFLSVGNMMKSLEVFRSLIKTCTSISDRLNGPLKWLIPRYGWVSIALSWRVLFLKVLKRKSKWDSFPLLQQAVSFPIIQYLVSKSTPATYRL